MKKLYTKKILNKIEDKKFRSDSFHKFTNNKALNTSVSANVPQSWIKIHFKTYPRFRKISFDDISYEDSKLGDVFKKRYSARKFSHSKISKNELAHLLHMSCGLTRVGKTINDSRRNYPSGGARYPLETYVIILNSEINKGLYHYNVKDDCLESIVEQDLSHWLMDATGNEEWIKTAAAIIIITGVLDRSRAKYGDRGYRYALIEAGHLGQNLCLLSSEMNLGTCVLGGFIDDKVNKLLDVNLQKEYALSMIAVGKI